MEVTVLNNQRIHLTEIPSLLERKIEIGDGMQTAVNSCRTFLDNYLASSEIPVYGINTGFGSLCNEKISTDQLEMLQENLVRSHACGVGDEIPSELVKLMILLKIIGLGKGYSGIHINTLELLKEFYNRDILPVVYCYGSLGASGDLAPLAHLSLVLMGEGEVWYKGSKAKTVEVFQKEGLVPVKLKAKEGLALLNGTQYMLAHGVWSCLEAKRLLKWGNFLAAASSDAFMCQSSPFDDSIHQVRGHLGAIETAAEIREWLVGSELQRQPREQVQDPYSFRCVPQVHGAVYDAIIYATITFEREINAVTDNPIIFPEENKIVSGGNFHGEPLAVVLDHLKVVLAELGSISERRTFKLISGKRGLPAFLTPNPGLNSGFMIPQYTAASLVSANKQYATPASVDTIDSSNGQEDHVSMGANAANQLFSIIKNTQQILSIELLNAYQAISLRKPLKSSPSIEGFLKELSPLIGEIDADRAFYLDLERVFEFLCKKSPK